MLAKRAEWTEAHDLSDALGQTRDEECAIVISDMPVAAWNPIVRGLVQQPVIFDISKYRWIK